MPGKKMLTAAIGMALAGAAGPAGAAAGWYAGLGAGATSIDNLDSANGTDLEMALGEFGVVASIDSLSTDDSDTGWKIFAGYQFNDYFAVEGYYADLGSYDVDFSGSVDGGEGAVALAGNVGIDAHGYGVFGVLGYPIGNFQVFGKFGGVHWHADVDTSISLDGEPGSATFGDDGNDFAWGAGVKYQFTDHIAVDVQFEQFDAIEDIDLTSASVRWMF